MGSTLEQYLAVDVGVLVSGAAACSHAAASHQPLHICSVTMEALEGFMPVAAGNLRVLPITVVIHADDDYDLIAKKLPAVKKIKPVKRYSTKLFLYAFAIAKRLEIPLLIRANDPELEIYKKLGGVFGVTVTPV